MCIFQFVIKIYDFNSIEFSNQFSVAWYIARKSIDIHYTQMKFLIYDM